MVEGKIYDFLIIYSNCNDFENTVFVLNSYLEKFVSRKYQNHCWIWSFLVEVGLLRGNLNSSIFIMLISHTQNFDMKFTQSLHCSAWNVKIDLVERRTFVQEFCSFVWHQKEGCDQTILEVTLRLSGTISDRVHGSCVGLLRFNSNMIRHEGRMGKHAVEDASP